MNRNTYRKRPASAFVRGWFQHQTNAEKLSFFENHPKLFHKHIFELTDQDMDELIRAGELHELSLYIFRTSVPFGVYDKVMSILKGIQPDNILDIGSNRGAFVWQLIDTFRYTSITAVESNMRYIDWMKIVHQGGITNLKPVCGEVHELSSFLIHEFDTITALNLLDYHKNYKKILHEICQLAKRFIIISTSVGKNDNPRHFHQFDEEDLRNIFREHHILQVKIERIQNHLITVARK